MKNRPVIKNFKLPEQVVALAKKLGWEGDEIYSDELLKYLLEELYLELGVISDILNGGDFFYYYVDLKKYSSHITQAPLPSMNYSVYSPVRCTEPTTALIDGICASIKYLMKKLKITPDPVIQISVSKNRFNHKVEFEKMDSKDIPKISPPGDLLDIAIDEGFDRNIYGGTMLHHIAAWLLEEKGINIGVMPLEEQGRKIFSWGYKNIDSGEITWLDVDYGEAKKAFEAFSSVLTSL